MAFAALSSPISGMKGIGKIQAQRMRELGILTLGDLLWHVPVRFEDMRPVLDASRMRAGECGTLHGVLEQIGARKTRAGKVLIEAVVRTGSGNVPLAWFGNKYLEKELATGVLYRFSGRVSADWPRGAAMVGPVFELSTSTPVQTARLLPVYDLTAGITMKMMRRYVMTALRLVGSVPEVLPAWVLKERGFMGRAEAFRALHDPSSLEDVVRAKERFAFEELFSLQVASELRRKEHAVANAPLVAFDKDAVVEFVGRLPFGLTNAQRRAAWQILQDMQGASGAVTVQPMQRLLNGDVGAGKTAVAAIAAYNVSRAGLQTAILAPTDILARQHFESFKKLFAHDGSIQIALLTQSARVIACAGSEENVPRKEFEPLLREGLVSVVIGTHAVIEDWVQMKRLALAIVDEQHRFGVKQREALKSLRGDAGGKYQLEPHFLSMTATPIPRSLSLAFFGDLDVSVLDELPPGRVPVATRILERKDFVRELGVFLARGERGYVVCPLIELNDELGVKSVEEVLSELQKRLPEFEFMGLHGKMKPEEKQQAMEWLRAKGGRTVVSTTVVEVGVDVPEATFMFIEAAERFGLAQLHQLRGRVGRSVKPGFCFLVPSEKGASWKRLTIMTKETSGFKIAEADLEMRGHGDLLGKSQSGFLPTFKVATFSDVPGLESAKTAAKRALEEGTLSPEAIEDIKGSYMLQAA